MLAEGAFVVVPAEPGPLVGLDGLDEPDEPDGLDGLDGLDEPGMLDAPDMPEVVPVGAVYGGGDAAAGRSGGYSAARSIDRSEGIVTSVTSTSLRSTVSRSRRAPEPPIPRLERTLSVICSTSVRRPCRFCRSWSRPASSSASASGRMTVSSR